MSDAASPAGPLHRLTQALRATAHARPGPRRLATRIFIVFVGLLLLVQAATFVFLRHSAETRERASIERQLHSAEQALQTQLAHNTERVVVMAHVMAIEHGLRQATEAAEAGRHAEIDRATVDDGLLNNLRRLCRASGPDARARSERCEAGAQAALFDVGGAVVGSVHGREAVQLALAEALQPAGSGNPCRRADGTGGAVLPHGGMLVQYVLVPRCSPLLAGWMLVGLPVDQSFADDLRRMSGVHVQLLSRLAPDAAWTNPVGTLQPAPAGALLQALGRDLPEGQVQAAEETYSLRALWLGQGAPGQAMALLTLSLDEALAPFRAMQQLLVLVTLAAVAVYAFGAALLSRSITQPLAALVRALRTMQAGRYDEPVCLPPRRDEVGAIAAGVENARIAIRERGAELNRMAMHDELTDLANRRSFFEQLRRHVVHEPETPCAVLLLSLNRFNVVQETLGPSCADKVLREVARRLRERIAVRHDVVARLGDHNFALLLHKAGAETAEQACDEVRVALIPQILVDGQTIDVEASCGIACWPQHAPPAAAPAGAAADRSDLGKRAEMLVARAELAMYFAREQVLGHMVYAADLDPDNADTLWMKSALRNAIDNGELRLFLQPKLDLATRRVVGAEALVRWQRGAELVPPMKFIPFAEDNGLVRELTKWVFEEAARLWPALQAMGLKRVAVNLSALDLVPELPQTLANVLARSGVPAGAFCLEVTESAIMKSPRRAQEVLMALNMAGFRLSIDDYGEGATSLQYLKRLPVHELKIDQLFIRRIDQDVKDAKIVRSTIGLAHSLGFEVVAEGVENAAALDLLAEMGANQVQGFHLSRPVPAAELAEAIRRVHRQMGVATSEETGEPGESVAEVLAEALSGRA